MHELKDRKPDDARLTPVAKAATAGIQSYFVDLLNERRRHPRHDLVTHLVNAEIDGVPFADEHIHDASEIMGLMLVLFLGGVESTAGLIGTLFKLLAENPDQREILRANPELIPDAVEEAIRIATPLQLVGRTTSREVTLHGVTIPAGGRVVLVYGAANRDERRFPDPDRFDVTRGKQRHLGFGEGMHGCIGAPLARLEAKIALEEALPLLGDYTLTDVPERYAHHAEHVRVGAPAPRVPRSPKPPAPRPPRAASRRPSHHTDTTVVTRELETEVRVAAKDERAEGVVALTLKTLDGAPLPEWTPGAHVDLVLGGGAPNRQYSLCGDVADRGAYRLGILRDASGGGGSRHVHERLRRGRRRAGARAAQQLRAGALAALPLHRGRHRHHADAADDRGGGGGGRELAARLRRPAAAPRWRSSTSWRRTATGSTVCPQDETGLLDLATRCSGHPASPTRSSTACGPEPLLAAVEQRCAGVAAPAPCTWSGSPPGRWARRCGPRPSTWAGAQRPHAHRAAGAVDHVGRRGGRGRACCPRARRAPAAPARPASRGAARPPRLGAARRREGDERLHDDLRLALLRRPPGAGPLGGRRVAAPARYSSSTKARIRRRRGTG